MHASMLLSRSSTSSAVRWKLCSWKARACLDDAHQMREEWVISICAIEPMISVGPIRYQANRAQVSELFLNGAKGEPALAHQLANVALLFGAEEKQPQDLGADFRE
jgi:hypothetical protein